MNFTTYNIMTGAGFDKTAMGEWSLAFLGLVVVFFMVILSKKWLGDEFDLGFNTIFGFIGAFGAYLLTITLTGAAKWAILASVVGLIVGGFILGIFFGDSGGEGGDY